MSNSAIAPKPEGTSGPEPTTLVLLCGDLRTAIGALDLDGICEWLERESSVRARVVPDLCHQPGAVAGARDVAASRAVLGLCSELQDKDERQRQARRHGLDPFRVAPVNLGDYCARSPASAFAVEKAKLMLTGAIAGVKLAAGSSPESVKVRLRLPGGKVSRRALFTLPPVAYQPVVALTRERCVSEAGCDLCVGVCPRDALSIVEGRLAVNKASCEACGACISACPRQALELPGASLAQAAAELAALLGIQDVSVGPKGILFYCEGNARLVAECARSSDDEGLAWLPMRLPCVGMVSAGWILQCLAHGAASVAIVSCGEGCPLRQEEQTRGRVAYCRQLLRPFEGRAESVRLIGPSSSADLVDALFAPAPAATVPTADGPVTLVEPSATAKAVRTLTAGVAGEAAASLPHPHSPLGVVRIDALSCTGCEACVRTCPTDALTSRLRQTTLMIAFDPELCLACAMCARCCPESVVRVERITDVTALRRGAIPLYEDSQARCERCGAAFAPAAMVRRVEALVQESADESQAISSIMRRCPDCRILGSLGRGPQAL